MLNIGLMEGSLPRASPSPAFARNAAALAPEAEQVSHLPGPGDLTHFNQDAIEAGMPPGVEAFGEAVGKGNALLIGTPEYNCGLRVDECLRQVLHSQGMHVMAKPEVPIAGAKGRIDVEKDEILNENTAAFCVVNSARLPPIANDWDRNHHLG